MNDSSTSLKLTIFGSYNQSSIGDKAILVSLLELLFSEAKGSIKVEVICFDQKAIKNEIKDFSWSNDVSVISLANISGLTNDDHRKHSSIKQIYFLIPRQLRTWIQTIWYGSKIIMTNLRSNSNGLIIGGGNLLMDMYPSWPLRLYLISRQFSQKKLPVIFAGVGAFPINTKIGKRLIEKSVRNATLVFVRDKKTQEYLINNFNITVKSHPDFALSFPIQTKHNSMPERQLRIAVNFAPIYSKWWPYQDQERYYKFIEDFARGLFEFFASVEGKITFWFYDSNLSDQPGTEELIASLLNLGIPKQNISHSTDIVTSIEIVQGLQHSRFAIVTRLHAGLLALRAGLPTITIVYQPKVKDVLHNIGLKKGIVEIDEMSTLYSRIDELEENSEDYRLSIDQINALDKENRQVISDILWLISDRSKTNNN